MKLKWTANHEDESKATEWRAHIYKIETHKGFDFNPEPKSVDRFYITIKDGVRLWGENLKWAKETGEQYFDREVEQRRFELVKAAMQGPDGIYGVNEQTYKNMISHADAMLKEYYKDVVDA